MAILEDRGIFWWNDELVPKEQFAPSSNVAGKLTISDDGSTRLDLDSVMPGIEHPFEALRNSGKTSERNIQGLLNGDSGYVLLTGVIGNGASFRTSNLSQERYLALNCLISKSQFRQDHKRPLSFRAVKVELTGLEDWLWLRGIETTRRRSTLTARYKKPKDRDYALPFGKLSIEYELSGPGIGKSKSKKLSLTQVAAVRVTPTRKLDLLECQTYYQRVEELVILLTSSDRSLDWPTVVVADGKQRAKLYFTRYKVDAEPPGAHNCLINFPKIADSFGALFSALLEKREQFGPGFYLYLGTRRGLKMFVEHRFVNLIWGLEAFDRRGRGEVQADSSLSEKIERILIGVTDPRDRKWLNGKLRHAAEPNLGKRLFEVFSTIPLCFDLKGLRRFCIECQDRRNDISHFGGLRHKDQTYDAFMRDLDKKSDALAALYHLHLLTVIGIDPERLNFATNHNWPLSRMEMDLRAAGVLKPKPPEPGPVQAAKLALQQRNGAKEGGSDEFPSS